MVPLYDVFSVLRPDGLGPHFLPREGECGTPCTMFFRTRSPLPLRTRVNMVINYHISVRSGLISRWNGYPSVRCFRTKLNGSIFLPGEGEIGTPPYDVSPY